MTWQQLPPEWDEHWHMRVAHWRDADPDPTTATETSELLLKADSGESNAIARLQDCFGSWLTFGTAGLRAELGPGPNRMNRVVVQRAAWALGTFLHTQAQQRKSAVGSVVVGFDARHGSAQFAHDTCAVLTGLGIPVMVLPRALPTPVLAHAVRSRGAAAGVMVTASHNPAADNGYKVYLGTASGLDYAGSQIVSPVDLEIAALFTSDAAPANPAIGDEWLTLDDLSIADYISQCADVIHTDGPRALRVAHTALHGVATDTFLAAAARAGFHDIHTVSEQAQPDPDFPTAPRPNPEEPGAIDLLLRTAAQCAADIAIAHDPDADRCAVALPSVTGWHRVSGDDIGLLLGWWRVQQHALGWRSLPADAVFANSIVSSSALARFCEREGIHHVQTLTGFKWLARVPQLSYGYEEALGYCVNPTQVHDKDGITAALAVMDCAAYLKRNGSDVISHIKNLKRELKCGETAQLTVPLVSPSDATAVLARILSANELIIAGTRVVETKDLSSGWQGLPPTPGIRLELSDGSHIIIRPSGTEPKLKAYLEVPDEHRISDVVEAVRAMLSQSDVES